MFKHAKFVETQRLINKLRFLRCASLPRLHDPINRSPRIRPDSCTVHQVANLESHLEAQLQLLSVSSHSQTGLTSPSISISIQS